MGRPQARRLIITASTRRPLQALAAVDSKRTGATLARGSCDAGSSGEGGAGGGPCASCREQLPQPSPPSRPCCRRGAAGAAAPAPRLAGFLAATCGGGACAGGAGPGGAREGRGARCSEEARGAPGKGRSGAAGREWEVAAAVSELDSIKGSRRAPHMVRRRVRGAGPRQAHARLRLPPAAATPAPAATRRSVCRERTPTPARPLPPLRLSTPAAAPGGSYT